MIIEIDWIRESVDLKNYEFSSHAYEECEEEDILALDVLQALSAGEILERYEERQDIRGISGLVLGYCAEGCPIHIVVAKTPKGRLRIVTVYIPKLPKWVDERTRRKK